MGNDSGTAGEEFVADPLGYPWYLNQDQDGAWDPDGAPARVAEWHAKREKEKAAWEKLSPDIRSRLLKTWIKYDGHVQDMPYGLDYSMLYGLRRYMPTVAQREMKRKKAQHDRAVEIWKEI